MLIVLTCTLCHAVVNIYTYNLTMLSLLTLDTSALLQPDHMSDMAATC